MKKIVLMSMLLIIGHNTFALRYLCTIFIGASGENSVNVLGNSVGWGNCKSGGGICVGPIINKEEKNPDYVDYDSKYSNQLTISISKGTHIKEVNDGAFKGNIFEFGTDSYLNANVLKGLGLSSEKSYFIEKGEYSVKEDANYFYITVKINSK